MNFASESKGKAWAVYTAVPVLCNGSAYHNPLYGKEFQMKPVRPVLLSIS
jgi:hypothetical protein